MAIYQHYTDMRNKNNKPEFWVTNISSMNVSLTDLNLTIKAFVSVNLLDSRHYKYSLSELQLSAASGSIYKKRDKLVIRKNAPDIMTPNVAINKDSIIPGREHSILAIKEEYYEELKISDEEFAAENADTADLDTKKQILFMGK